MDKPQVEMSENAGPANTKLVQALKKLCLERVRTEVEMHKRLFEVECEFQEKLKAFDDKRRMIVSGDYLPTDEECKYEYSDEKEEIVESQEKGIPDFWTAIFYNLDIISDMVRERDQDALNSLTDIRCVLLKDPMGYRLEFEFAENEYFTNKILTKDYFFAPSYDPADPLNYDSPYVNQCKGCKIDWKSEEKDLTKKKVAAKLRHRSSKQVKTVEKVVKGDSFFNFFDPPEEKIEDADIETKDLLASDFDIGETFRLNVIPRAIIYYTGEGIEEDDEEEPFDDFENYEDEDDEDDDEEEDDEEEEDDDEDVEKQKKDNKKSSKAKGLMNGGVGKHKSAGGPRGQSGGDKKMTQSKETPPECKQQ